MDTVHAREQGLYALLESVSDRPKPFEFYTAEKLWNDEHISAEMLKCHLDPQSDLASRRLSFIEASVDWLAGHCGISAGTRVIDFGCGPGLYTYLLAQKGALVTGVDFSRRSIEYARQEAQEAGLGINYVLQNYLQYETDERFEVILLIYCDLCALSPAQRGVLLRKFASILPPGGRVVLDAPSLAYFEKKSEGCSLERNLQGGFWSEKAYFAFQNTFKYEKDKLILDKYTLVSQAGTETVYNWFQCFSPESLGAEFEAAGLKIDELFGDVAGKPFSPEADEFAVVARKL